MVLRNGSGSEVATFSGTTAWTSTGYSHAKEFTLDIVLKVQAINDFISGTRVYWFISTPKKRSPDLSVVNTKNMYDYFNTNPTPYVHDNTQFYETIQVTLNPTNDLRIKIYENTAD